MPLRQRSFPATSLVFQLTFTKGSLLGVVGSQSYLWWTVDSMKRFVGSRIFRRLTHLHPYRTMHELLDPAARRGLYTRHLISEMLPHYVLMTVLERCQPTRALAELLRTDDLFVIPKRGPKMFLLKVVDDPTLPGALPFYRWIRGTLFGPDWDAAMACSLGHLTPDRPSSTSPEPPHLTLESSAVSSTTASSSRTASSTTASSSRTASSSSTSDTSGYVPSSSGDAPPDSPGYSPCSPAYEPPPASPGYCPSSPVHELPPSPDYSPCSPAYEPPPSPDYTPLSPAYEPPPKSPLATPGYSACSPAYEPPPEDRSTPAAAEPNLSTEEQGPGRGAGPSRSGTADPTPASAFVFYGMPPRNIGLLHGGRRYYFRAVAVENA